MCPVDTTDSFTPASTRQGLDRWRLAGTDRRVRWRAGLLAWWLAALWLVLARPLGAAEPDIRDVSLQRTADGLYFSARLALAPSAAVEEALLKGVPLYFVWQAEVVRDRWYWTDKRLAQLSRTWRLVYQPLTRRWRLSLSNDAASGGPGGLQYALHQNFDSLSEALASVGRVSRWKLVGASRLQDGADERVEWRFRLDLSLLPRPFQFGMANQPEWVIDVQRRLAVPAQVEPTPPGQDAGSADGAIEAAR
jgi:hypothetical protein